MLALARPASARSYYLQRMDVAGEVRADGSVHVRETRDVVFRGSFRGFDRDIPLGRGVQIANVVVSENGRPYRLDPVEQPGTYNVVRRGRDVRVSWGYAATDETRTFVLEYDLLGAVVRHADIAELYWKAIEPEHAWQAKSSRVVVTLPEAAPHGTVRAWAHGPLWGRITISPEKIELVCDPLPRNNMVELRAVFPADFVPNATRATSDRALPGIEAQEAQWVAAANRARVAARARLVAQVLVPLAVVLGGFAIWLALYLRYGTEYREANPPMYEREPPSPSTPVQLSYLLHWESLGPNDVTATVMDLVRRGALRLIVTSEKHPVLGGLLGESTRQEYSLERVPERQGDLTDSERYLIGGMLFHGVQGNVVSMDTIRQNSQREPQKAYQRFQSWQRLAKRECKQLRVIDPASKRAMGVGIGIGSAVFAATFPIAGLFNSPSAALTGIGGMALIVASTAIRRRTRESAALLHRWQAFRRYLTDFSRLKEYPAPAVALWEQYLVYAITLGVADRVIEQFKELYPQVAETAAGAAFAHWVTPGGSPLRGVDAVGAALSSFSQTLATATSSFSSASGGGGGFSGGGGGGVGGGSSGAR